jgi:dTDP-glucose pyrophosphorylase/CBS domain-containing protein
VTSFTKSAVWKKTIVTPGSTIRNAIDVINDGVQICLVADEETRLIGTITDGDIRRGLLAGRVLENTVEDIINRSPQVAKAGTTKDALLNVMQQGKIFHIPLVDDTGRIVDLATLKELRGPYIHHENWVVLMAGGLGSRLMPLTDNTPKPLLHVGDKPLLETILRSFTEQNFKNFFVAVNYKADFIKNHFGNGDNWNIDLRYLEEKEKLGTAGALDLLPECPDKPLIVMNGDLLTRVNFSDLLEYHKQHNALATMCVREYEFQVPFGVIETENNRISRIDEKPVHRFFVNAGIYVIEPEILDLVPSNQKFDMTELFEKIISMEIQTAVFPIHEYWLDVGRMEDFDRANMEYQDTFGR